MHGGKLPLENARISEENRLSTGSGARIHFSGPVTKAVGSHLESRCRPWRVFGNPQPQTPQNLSNASQQNNRKCFLIGKRLA